MIAVEVMLLAFAAGAITGGVVVYFWVRDWAEICWQAGKVEGSRRLRMRLFADAGVDAEKLPIAARGSPIDLR